MHGVPPLERVKVMGCSPQPGNEAVHSTKYLEHWYVPKVGSCSLFNSLILSNDGGNLSFESTGSSA